MAKIDWAVTLRALRSRNYRLFFTGQTVSLIGTWMTRIATVWLVYRLTDSALLLGITGFAGQIPAFFLAPIAGVWLYRWDKHRAPVVTQVLPMLQSFALAARVANLVFDSGLARLDRSGDMVAFIRQHVYGHNGPVSQKVRSV
jgi:hypothetical protein